MSNQIQLANTVDSPSLALAVNDLLTQRLYQAAEENIRNAVGDVSAYTALEMRAMVMTEALRLTSGMDLSTIITRGQIIRQIEQEGLAGVHPNGYANLTDLAKENNVSVGELSDIRALCDVIFPYITDTLGFNLMEVWDQIGKSTFREMVPALRALITGENADHSSVRTAVAQMLTNAAASMVANDEMTQEQLSTPEGTAAVRATAVITLLNDATVHTTREMRRRVRPSRVPAVSMATIQTAETEWYAVLKLDTQEQRDLVVRILNPHTNNMNLDGRDAREQRRALRSFFGE